MRSILFATALALPLLASCAAGQTRYGVASLDDLKPGVTRERDLIGLFGMPTFTVPTRDNSSLWTWQYTPDQSESHDGLLYLTVLLDSDGRMVKVTKVIRQ